MAKYAFLSDEWVSEAQKIRAEYTDHAPEISISVKMNVIVKDAPSAAGSVDAHVDTSSGRLDLDVGHLDDADLTLTVDTATAKAILIDGDPQAAMSAFMGGRIKVDGDITKLLALQSAGIVGGADPLGSEIAERINAITE